jgi:hypothetical protein
MCPQVTTEMSELKLKDQGYYMGYSSSNQAGTFNGVAISALQVFLSMIPPELVSTYIHTYIHTYTYTYIHACMHTYIRMNFGYTVVHHTSKLLLKAHISKQNVKNCIH